MRTREDIESYLIRSQLAYDEVDGREMWLLHDAGSGESIVVSLAGPLVLFRVKVLDLAEVRNRERLFEKLLELNASEMVHGAYGVSDGAVVLTCTLRLEHLDYSEFQGTIDDFSVALTNHYSTLASFRSAA
jgi:hypothetical protein